MDTIAEFESNIRSIEALIQAKALEELTKKALQREVTLLEIASKLEAKLLRKFYECTETAKLESKVGQLKEKKYRASETGIIKSYYRFAFCRQSSLI